MSMRQTHGLLLWLATCVMGLLTTPAFSAVTVQVGGYTITSPSGCPTGSTEVIISDCTGAPRQPFANACFTIAGYVTGQPAKVRADNQTIDQLYLENARISAISANCTSDLLFFDTFTPGPSATTKPITFTRSTRGTGSLFRPSTNQGAIGSFFKVTGYINDNGTGDNEIATYQQKTVFVAADYQFDFSKSEDWIPVSLQGNRVMKARFWFKLSQAQDELRLPNGAAVESTAGGGSPGRHDHSVANDPSLTTGEDEHAVCCAQCPDMPLPPREQKGGGQSKQF